MAIQYFTDKNAVFQKREIFPAEYMRAAVQLTPSTNSAFQGFRGFGVAITGSSCYLLSKMDKDARTALLCDLYTAQGINLSVARLSVGSSDYSAELYSYDDVPFDTSLEHFSIARDEEYIIPMIKEILTIRPDLYIFAAPWSPPGWMKTGGDMCGGYMRAEFIDCYADYIVKFIKAYAEHGIKISAITPQNETETDQDGKMPACIWHPEIEAEYAKILKKKLDDAKLDVKVWFHDHNFSGHRRVEWCLDNISKLADSLDGVAFHYYGGNIESTLDIPRRYPHLELNFTEGGPRLYDNYSTDWCKWGTMMTKVVSCGYKSMTGWNLMLDECGGPNIGPFFCGGLVTKNSLSGELSYSGQYKAFKHFAPYITPKSRIYALQGDENMQMFGYPASPRPVFGIMIENEGQTVLVLVNHHTDKKQVQFTVGGVCYYAELLADTISTIII